MACAIHKCTIIGLFGPGSRTVVEVPQTEIAYTLAVAESEHKQRLKLADKIKLGTKTILAN